MKRLICIAIVALCASAMVACDNTTKGVSRVTMGDKSKIDSLSYCVGFLNTVQFCLEMPDAKLDWNTVAEACSKALLKSLKQDDEKLVNESTETCVIFFDSTRIERLTKIKTKMQNGDPNKDVDISDELPKIDIFESPEERERISWAVGYDMGYSFRRMSYSLQVHWLLKGLYDGINPENISLVPQCQAYVNYFDEVISPLTNAEASAKWLSNVNKEMNVKRSESGLLYRIIEMGDEQNKPNIHSKVTLHYEVICHDGHLAATTYPKGIPSVIQVEKMVKGWAEGMQLIGKGGKITIWIPSELAFGKDGNRFVGPNEALRMNIELLDVETPNVQVQNIEWSTPTSGNK